MGIIPTQIPELKRVILLEECECDKFARRIMLCLQHSEAHPQQFLKGCKAKTVRSLELELCKQQSLPHTILAYDV